MLRKLSTSVYRTFCLNNRLNRIFDITFQIKDVTMLKGTQSQTPYFYIDKDRIELPIQDMIFSINTNHLNSDSIVEFLDKDLNIYHPTTPLQVVVQAPFFVRRRGEVYCVMNNEPFVYGPQGEEFEITQCSRVVEEICQDSIMDLPENGKQIISGPSIHNLMVTNLLKHSMNSKIEKMRLKQLLTVVNRQIQLFNNEIQELQYSIKRKANRRLRNFTSFLVMQYAVMHYYIYHNLSWDIMEPITVIFANIDLFVGYLFFVMRGREWSLGEIHGSYISRNKYYHLKANGINVEKYDQLLKIQEYLQFRLKLLSKSPYELMEALKKPIKMLDTR